MALADRLDQPRRRASGSPCSVGELEAALEGREATAFSSMMYELGWSQEKIYAALKAEGHIVGKQTINRHRSRSCRCFL